MLDWLYKYIEKKFEKRRIDKWICSGTSEGLDNYHTRYKCYPEYVVDIGAHYGSLSRAALDKGAKKVFAIEASKENYKRLVKNLAKSKNEAATICINGAFCENCTSKVKLIANKKGNSGQKSLLYIIHGSADDYFFEDCHPIDRIDIFNMMERIDYLKIDIEGNEFYALPFDDETKKLLSKVKFLDIELHSLSNPAFFDKKAFLDTHPSYDPAKDIIQQFIEFLGSCGFYMPSDDMSGHGAVKLFTANKNLE